MDLFVSHRREGWNVSARIEIQERVRRLSLNTRSTPLDQCVATETIELIHSQPSGKQRRLAEDWRPS